MRRQLHRRWWMWDMWMATLNGLRRCMDIVGSLAGLILLSPLFLLTAIAIYLENPGPLFFTQKRVGRFGRLFPFYKFRSMYTDAEARKAALMAQNESSDGVIFKMKNDPRITRVGKVIRRFSIDELPQLYNVLKGDLALVGPRPPVPSEVAQYTLEDRKRLHVKPGLTCIWQIKGRSDIPFNEQVQLDQQYIRSRSLWTDVLIILQTIPAVLLGRGAY